MLLTLLLFLTFLIIFGLFRAKTLPSRVRIYGLYFLSLINVWILFALFAVLPRVAIENMGNFSAADYAGGVRTLLEFQDPYKYALAITTIGMFSVAVISEKK